MRINLNKQQTIQNYAHKHAESKASFEDFINKIKAADWDIPEDMKATFGSVDALGKGSERVVFNIGGNNHRLICKYKFRETYAALYVCWLGIHAEYTALCKKNEQYTAENHKDFS
ncbi:MAG: type II toxin-antitoxin system HigB family toxin [Balneolaceae bacterium]